MAFEKKKRAKTLHQQVLVTGVDTEASALVFLPLKLAAV